MAILDKNTALVINTMMAPWISDLFDNQLLATSLGVVNPAGDITGKNGDTVKTPKRGSLTARSKVPTVDFVFDDVDSSLLTFGTVVQKYRAFNLETTTFKLLEAGKTQLVEGYLQDAVSGLAETIDTAFLGLYASLSASESGSALDDTLMNTVANTLDGAKVPRADRHMIVSNDVWNTQLMNATTNSIYNRADGIGAPASQTVANSSLGSIRGFNVHMSPLVPSTVGSPTVSHCMAFQRGALGIQFVNLYDTNDLPGSQIMSMNYKGAPIRVGFHYDFAADKYQCRVDIAFAVGILWDEKGVAVDIDI
jgi:hypothetical protein